MPSTPQAPEFAWFQSFYEGAPQLPAEVIRRHSIDPADGPGGHRSPGDVPADINMADVRRYMITGLDMTPEALGMAVSRSRRNVVTAVRERPIIETPSWFTGVERTVAHYENRIEYRYRGTAVVTRWRHSDHVTFRHGGYQSDTTKRAITQVVEQFGLGVSIDPNGGSWILRRHERARLHYLAQVFDNDITIPCGVRLN